MDPIRVIWASPLEAHIVAGADPTACYRALAAVDIEGVQEVTPGSRTVQLRLRVAANPDASLARAVSIIEGVRAGNIDQPRIIEIPICCDPDFAPDLERVAHDAGLTSDAASDLHASAEYRVRFLGFSPGFAYMDGLPTPLHAPRLDSPRPRVRAGSVGIAGARTGIYPSDSPGGWRLIGATPLRMFDPAREDAALLSPGDRVRFRRITRAEFDALARGAG